MFAFSNDHHLKIHPPDLVIGSVMIIFMQYVLNISPVPENSWLRNNLFI